MKRLVVIAVACMCLTVASCSNAPTIFVQVNLDPALPAVDQLSFSIDKAGAASLGPSLKPDAPSSEPLTLEQSVRLALPESYAGTVTVKVIAWGAGAEVGRGQADGLARASSETTVVVNVNAQQICDATSCPNGCCEKGLCVEDSRNLCGSGGGVCAACDPVAADRCVGGACKCGLGAECMPGQTCLSGACTCDSTTCPSGCCDGNSCLPGNTNAQCGSAGSACSACATGSCDGGVCPDCAANCDGGCCSGNTCLTPTVMACGSGGAACTSCNTTLANNCSNGSCRCGTSAPCASGQRCVNGACQCDNVSCPRGCCQAGVCRTPSAATCGTDGGTCTACTAARADSCSASGQCTCGTGAACVAPASCVGGSCLCDGGSCASTCNASTCPNGCCSNGVCQVSDTDSCGTGGAACRDCTTVGDRCENGVCRCKNNPVCQPGQRCTNVGGGSCRCDSQSNCPGCCQGDNCMANSFSQCGASGVDCFACNALNSNQCLNGSCRCGNTGGTCGGALRCSDAGTCI